MKSPENELFTEIATMLREKYADIYVTGDSTAAPSRFPCVFFEQTDRYTVQESMDTSDEERSAILLYRADIFSNKASGRKTQTVEIENAIWELLYRHNFTQFSNAPLQDMGDKIYHRVATYRVKWDGKAFYRI